MIVNNSKTVIVLSTYQEPHYSDFYLLSDYKLCKPEAKVIDVAKNAPFRVDLPQKFDTSRQKISKIFRNHIRPHLFRTFKKRTFEVYAQDLSRDFRENETSDDLLVTLRVYESYVINKSQRSFAPIDVSLMSKFNDLRYYAKNFARYLIRFHNPECVFIFNGRLPLEYFILHYLNRFKKGIKFKFLETNQFSNRIVVRNDPIHDLASYKKEIIEFSKKNNSRELALKVNEIQDSWKSKFDCRPTGEFKKRYGRYAVFLTGSFDEYDFFYDNYIDQLAYIDQLDNILQKKGVKLVVRVHPNTREKSEETQLFWKAVYNRSEHLVVPHDSDISTYDLLREALFSISTGTSLAPQSYFNQHPHVVLGNYSYYSDLSGFYVVEPKSFLKTLSQNNGNLDNLIKNIIQVYDRPKNDDLVAASLIFERELGLERKKSHFATNPLIVNTTFGRSKIIDERNLKVYTNKLHEFLLNTKNVSEEIRSNGFDMDLVSRLRENLWLNSNSDHVSLCEEQNDNIFLFKDLVPELAKFDHQFFLLAKFYIYIRSITQSELGPSLSLSIAMHLTKFRSII